MSGWQICYLAEAPGFISCRFARKNCSHVLVNWWSFVMLQELFYEFQIYIYITVHGLTHMR